MYAKITAHKGFLVVELLAKRSIAGQVTTNLDKPACAGTTIHDTKNNLGVSPEALELLKSLKRAKHSIGELDWSRDLHGSPCFGWIGDAKKLFNAKTTEVSKSWRIWEHIPISNDVPSEVKQALYRCKQA